MEMTKCDVFFEVHCTLCLKKQSKLFLA